MKRIPWNTGKKLTEEHKKKLSKSRTLEGYIERLGEVEGRKQYLEKNSKLSVGIDSLKQRGYTEEQIKDIREKHKNKSMVTKESFISKYGEQEGIKRYSDIQAKKKKNNHRTYSYWLSFFEGDESLAKEALRKVQSREKEFFTIRYGEIEGELRYQEHLKSKVKSFENRTFNNAKSEKELGKEIEKLTDKKVYYGIEKYYIFLNEEEQELVNRKFIIPDITIPELKLIIEYYGDYWHCSKEMFKDENYIHPYIKKFVKEIREVDANKRNLLENKGWKVMVIWESDYNKDSKKIIEAINNEINKH